MTSRPPVDPKVADPAGGRRGSSVTNFLLAAKFGTLAAAQAVGTT
jgi:hypothetical protein